MKSLTFIIPVRIDNETRLQNLLTSLRYITSTFPKSEFIVIESSPDPKCADICKEFNVNYKFSYNCSNFSKSESINFALKSATREYVMPYDLDILIPKKQIVRSIMALNTGWFHIILPHAYIVVDVDDPIKLQLSDNFEFKLVPRCFCLWIRREKDGIKYLHSGSGVAIFRKDILVKIGGFNKKMISYGWEDTELLKRAEKLGIYYYSLCWGNIIHLHHERGLDSQQNDFYNKNKEVFLNVNSMNSSDLIHYIQSELAIDKEECISIAEARIIKHQNIVHLSYLHFVINKLILRFLGFQLTGLFKLI